MSTEDKLENVSPTFGNILLAAVNFKEMSKSKEEILAEKLHVTINSLSYKNHTPPTDPSKILDAMQEYADQEAKAYANWLANQVIAGRTATKLFDDYKAQFTVSA